MSPSQRFRFEHYLVYLQQQGYAYDYEAFIDSETWSVFFKPGNGLKKSVGVLKGFYRRIATLTKLKKYSYVFIHREVAPVGPPIFEWWIAKIAKKKIIYDFDDAIWLRASSESNPYSGLLKCPWKVRMICGWAWKVSAGNNYLATFARQFNSNVVKLVTVVDTTNVHNRIKNGHNERAVIGWTGTLTNFHYLNPVLPVLVKLSEKFDFRFMVIAGHDPHFTELEYEFIPWKKETEIEDLLALDIGLMPLLDTASAKGKCAFKAIQYMALGIPAVVSNVGANAEVVDDGINGFVCEGFDEWLEALSTLLQNIFLRKSMGLYAQQKIVDQFSVEATKSIFLSLFKP